MSRRIEYPFLLSGNVSNKTENLKILGTVKREVLRNLDSRVSHSSSCIRQKIQLCGKTRRSKSKIRLSIFLQLIPKSSLLSYLLCMKIKGNNHNHEKPTSPSGDLTHKNLTNAPTEQVKHMTKAGVKLDAILSAVSMTDGESFENSRTINSAIFSMRIEQFEGKSPVDALLDNLQ